ncbi:MAG: CopD family protein [Acidobacteria bacterium]|nr:CopD family protein [Acidobacteriota bacterium]
MTTYGRGGFRVMAGALVVLLALVFLPSSAGAHARLLRSQPAAGSTAGQPPKLVELWFNEELEPNLNTVEVKDARGGRVDRGEVTLGEGGKKVEAALDELASGTYAVEWKAVSADGHTIRGRFNFTVAGDAAAAAASQSPSPRPKEPAREAGTAATPVPQAQVANTADESPITWADSLDRWLGYLAMMTLFGGFAVRLFVLGPALGHEGAGEGDAASATAVRRTLVLLRAGVIVLLAALLVSLVMQSSEVFGGGLAEAASVYHLRGLIGGTGFGRSWLLQAAAATALLVVTVLLGRTFRAGTAMGGAGLWWAGLLAAAVLLYGPVMTGHAAAAAKEYALSSASDWLHLMAAGFWVGGLFHLALALPPALSRLNGVRRTRALARVITLFTRLAVPCVAVLLLAGLYNSWTHVGSLSELWDTPYGRTLLVKVLLVLLMLALGALNGFRLGPRADQLAAAGDGSQDAGVERGFVRSVKAEALLGVLVLLATAALVFITPARGHAAGDMRVNPAEIHEGR